MPGAIQCLTIRPPVAGTSTSRHRNRLHPVAHSQISGRKSSATPLTWKRISVTRTPSIGAAVKCRQGDGNGEHGLPQVSSSNRSKPLAKFVTDNFLPLALVSGVVLGFANPSLGCLADTYYLSKVSTFGIYLISGLTLHNAEISAAVEAWQVGLFGVVFILFLSPLFSKIILQLKLQPQEFVTGIAIFTCMPTTLSSGVALTRLAGGNSALALAMTLISNLLGILIIPFSITKFIASGVGVSISSGQLLRGLLLTLLLPVILGKITRDFSKGVADFADRNRQILAMISATLLGLVPWMQVSKSRSLLLVVKPEIFLVAVVLGVLLHGILFVFNALVIQAFSLVSNGKSSFAKKENASALLLVASQKTLPVMVAVVEQLGGSLGESGLLVLPCVAAHLNQIIIDSFLVGLWKEKEDALGNSKVA
ncbi:probable sodium/metabolite cotransporter BASS4, chloroplastic isoform X2 [Henckelia pumila]|uniref:probable sodium/metabolite cotransporter BASS4, chloroplastic isoform X2 n=1 Tax=Henckelia pumila TaxID=405737 RepID=UPI003C6DBEDC